MATGRCLELGMEPRAENVYRASVGIESRIEQELVVRREPDRIEEIHTVEGFGDTFRRLTDPAVSHESVDTTHAEILRMNVGDPAHAEADACDVERSTPGRAACNG